jgi:hypothetical protein
MTAERDSTQPDQSTNTGFTAILIIGTFTSLGLFLAVTLKDGGILKESIWIGMGFAMIYLLSVVANNLRRLESDS